MLGLAALAGLAACAPAALPPKEAPVEPIVVERLVDLVPRAGLVWLLRARPRDVAQVPWLIPAIARIVPEVNFDAFKARLGFDLRQVPEAVLADHGPPMSAGTALVRHNVDPAALDRAFTKRLTSEVGRSSDRADVARVSGRLGSRLRALATIGRDVAVYQQGGDAARGTARVASLLATKKLSARAALDGEPLGPLMARFGDAPVVALALGPFEEEWKRAARGLLEIATAVGAAARPTARENVGLALALTGEFGDRGSEAADTLRDAWGDVAASGTGSVLGLDRPVQAPVVAGDRGVVTLAVELEPNRLAEGLRALVAEDLGAILRLDA